MRVTCSTQDILAKSKAKVHIPLVSPVETNFLRACLKLLRRGRLIIECSTINSALLFPAVVVMQFTTWHVAHYIYLLKSLSMCVWRQCRLSARHLLQQQARSSLCDVTSMATLRSTRATLAVFSLKVDIHVHQCAQTDNGYLPLYLVAVVTTVFTLQHPNKRREFYRLLTS